MDSKNNHSLVKKVCLIFFSCLLTLLLLEGSARVYSHLVTDYDLEMWKYAKYLKKRTADPRGHIHEANKKLRLMGVDVETDESGNRVCGFSGLKIGHSRPLLAFIGDSLTFGWGVEAPSTFACLIGKEFLKKFPQGSVQNFGVGNYNIEAVQNQFQLEVKGLQSQVIIWGFYINDLELNSHQEHSFLSEHSVFYAWIKGLVHRMRWWSADKQSYQNYYTDIYNQNKKTFLQSVDSLHQEITQSGSKLYVVLLPDLNALPGSAIDGIYDDINRSLREIQIETLNLHSLKEWRTQDSWISKQDSHPNKKVHQQIYEHFCRHYPPICKE